MNLFKFFSEKPDDIIRDPEVVIEALKADLAKIDAPPQPLVTQEELDALLDQQAREAAVLNGVPPKQDRGWVAETSFALERKKP